jgi:hypothetical protein
MPSYGNWFFAILLTAGVSFPLQLNELVAVCQFKLSANGWKTYSYYESQNRFLVGNAGKLSAMNVNGISFIRSLQRVHYALDRNMPYIFA